MFYMTFLSLIMNIQISIYFSNYIMIIANFLQQKKM